MFHAVRSDNMIKTVGQSESIPGFLKSLKIQQSVFLNVYGAMEFIPRNEFRQPMSGRYDNPIPPRFLAPIDFLGHRYVKKYNPHKWVAYKISAKEIQRAWIC